MFLVTAFSFLSLYNGFTEYRVKKMELLLCIATEVVLLTTIVPTFLSENVSRLNGVASSAEVIAPVTMR